METTEVYGDTDNRNTEGGRKRYYESFGVKGTESGTYSNIRYYLHSDCYSI
ncbi:MAG: hypothetical protein JSU85_09160 [Candidatus Zixiibacteriota bacterium]|nr:MAG: hypothetical protein JSU85_09160 [candidate division Zixibacteria bacterium]